MGTELYTIYWVLINVYVLQGRYCKVLQKGVLKIYCTSIWWKTNPLNMQKINIVQTGNISAKSVQQCDNIIQWITLRSLFSNAKTNVSSNKKN
jgi:hypothetical protein